MKFEGIVIGGGPAGMFAAITAAQKGQRVLLLERNGRLGKKLLITGKGRCNVTNDCTAQEVLQNIPRNGRFLFSTLTAFPPERIMEFFNTHGCPLKTERGNRVFPVSDKSVSVLDCLQRELRRENVTVKTARVREILTAEGRVQGVKTQEQTIPARWVILATGGLSYPTTGSTGDGYAMAEQLGHTIVPGVGSLVPLETAGQDCQDMQGLSLRNVGVKLLSAKGKVLYRDFGELLFTHFGVSGPTVLSASCHLKGEGCRLVINCSRSEKELLALADELRETCHVDILTSIGDVSDYAYMEQLFSQSEARFGGVDILVNNAGISHIGLLEDMTIDEWNRIIGVNLTSVFSASKLALPHMIHQKSGKILNISSIWGNVGASCEVAYSACKGGINSFTRALAKELAPSNIQVNAIACGVIDTEMNACFSEEERTQLAEEIPAGRFGAPEEVASLAVQITTGNDYLTGQIITLDGGYL